jgi:serine/threonine protein kinase
LVLLIVFSVPSFAPFSAPRADLLLHLNTGRLRWPEGARSSSSVATVAATKPLSKLLPDPTFRDLVEQLLTYDPAKRITAKQALQHPFFDQIRHEFEPRQQQPPEPSQQRHYAAAASSASSSSSSASHHRDWERDRDRDRERERERPRQQQAVDPRFALFDAQQERAAFLQAEAAAAAAARSRQQYRMSPPRNAHSRHDDQRNDDRRDYHRDGGGRLTPPRSSFGGAPLPPRSAQHHDDGYSDRHYSYHEEKAHRR